MTSVRIRPRTLDRVRPGLLATAVIAIVLGILGMHGVDAHGVNMHGARAHAETASSMGAMPAHELVAAEHGGSHLQAQPLMSDGELPSYGRDVAGGMGHAGGMSGMVMLCVAMLAGAAATLLALFARGGPQRVWALMQLARRVWRPAPRTLRVGTGPPHVWRFSVIRC